MNLENINININKDDPSINDYLFCTSVFGEIPNRILIFNSYKIDKFTKFLEGIYSDKKISKEIIPGGDNLIINEKVFAKIEDGIYLSYVEYDKTSELGVITDLVVFFKSGKEKETNSFIESLSPFMVDFQGGENMQQRFNLLMLTSEGLQLEPIDVLNSDFDNIELYYNDDVLKRSKKLSKSIKNTKKGLSIIYGERGNGKTTLIIDILSNVDKICMFIPASMIDITINSNEFKSFIKRYKNSVIIIDDCEIFFSHTYTKSNVFTNNLLQMVDGVCSDMNSLHIVTIFNTENIDNIDPVLMECNNYITSIEVDRLKNDKVEELCRYLGQKNKFKKPRLIDVIRKNYSSDEIQEMGF